MESEKLKETYDLGYNHGRSAAIREFVAKLRDADDGTAGTYIMREKISSIADEYTAEIEEEKTDARFSTESSTA